MSPVSSLQSQCIALLVTLSVSFADGIDPVDWSPLSDWDTWWQFSRVGYLAQPSFLSTTRPPVWACGEGRFWHLSSSQPCASCSGVEEDTGGSKQMLWAGVPSLSYTFSHLTSSSDEWNSPTVICRTVNSVNSVNSVTVLLSRYDILLSDTEIKREICVCFQTR